VIAVLLADSTVGALPAVVSPNGLAFLLAVAGYTYALAAVLNAASGHRDNVVKDRPETIDAWGIVLTGEAKVALAKSLGVRPSSLPSRATLSSARDGLALWSSPGPNILCQFSWDEIKSVTSERVYSTGRLYQTICIGQSESRSFALPLAPGGPLGFSSPSANDIVRALREQWLAYKSS
jgi:hypothetical protein